MQKAKNGKLSTQKMLKVLKHKLQKQHKQSMTAMHYLLHANLLRAFPLQQILDHSFH